MINFKSDHCHEIVKSNSQMIKTDRFRHFWIFKKGIYENARCIQAHKLLVRTLWAPSSVEHFINVVITVMVLYTIRVYLDTLKVKFDTCEICWLLIEFFWVSLFLDSYKFYFLDLVTRGGLNRMVDVMDKYTCRIKSFFLGS